jgi:hypothetical protein
VRATNANENKKTPAREPGFIFLKEKNLSLRVCKVDPVQQAARRSLLRRKLAVEFASGIDRSEDNARDAAN